MGLFDFLWKSAFGSMPKFEKRRVVGRDWTEACGNSAALGWAGATTRLAARRAS
jgi:hypothetical protein